MSNDTEVEENNDNDDIGENVMANTNLVSDAALKRQRNRRKRKLMELKYPSSFKYISNLPEGLFNNHTLQNIEINKIYKAHSKHKDILAEISSSTAVEIDEDLVFSVVLGFSII